MPVKSRRSYKGAPVSNTLQSSLAAGATSITLSATMSGWPTGSEPFFCVIDPGTSKEEKVCVVYASTTTLTVVDPATTSGWSASANGRGADDTTDRNHDAGATIYPVFTALEANQANELVSKYSAQGAMVYQGASTFTTLTVGTAAQVLKVNSGATAPEWGQVATAGIADGAVTSAKIADGTIAKDDMSSTLLKLICPVGTIAPYGGASAPTGWLLCDGTAIGGTYTELIALVGANTPDLRGKFLLGKAASGTGSTLLGSGGSTTIAEANLPSHSHGLNSHTHTIDHNHAASGSHSHTVSGGVGIYDSGTSGTWGLIATNQTGNLNAYIQSTVSSPTGAQTVDLDNFSGTSGGPSTANTTTTGSGTAYYQPFVAVNYIIKHDY